MQNIAILLFTVLLVGQQKVDARNIWGEIGQDFVSCVHCVISCSYL